MSRGYYKTIILSLIFFQSFTTALLEPAAQKADFSNVLFIGDSLTAGFQSGSLIESGQEMGFPNQIAKQAGFDLIQPLIGGNGIPPQLEIMSLDPLVIAPVAGSSGERIPQLAAPPFFLQATNLAVPGHTVQDALTKRPDLPIDSLTDVVLGLPGLLLFPQISKSQIEWAEGLDPSFVFVWIGNNDVLGFATSGGTVPLTPTASFESQYRELIERVAATGADAIVANIPDVTTIPFFTSAEDLAKSIGAPLSVIGPDLGIQEGDFVTLPGISMINTLLDGDPGTVLPDSAILDAGEVLEAENAVSEFNEIIRAAASEHGIPVVDIFGALNRIRLFGTVVNGARLTADFLGGLISLDGVHPTNTGYAIVANEFIKTLNNSYGTGIKKVPVNQVAAEDPLVIEGVVKKPPKSLVRGGVDADAINEMLRQVFKFE